MWWDTMLHYWQWRQTQTGDTLTLHLRKMENRFPWPWLPLTVLLTDELTGQNIFCHETSHPWRQGARPWSHMVTHLLHVSERVRAAFVSDCHQPTATPYQFPVQNNLSIFSLPLSARGNGNCLKQYSVAPRSGRCVCKVGRRYPRRDIELHYSNGGMCG